MDQNTLVGNLRKMSNRIIEDHKSVSLIMLLGNNTNPMERTSSYDYVISAKWLDNYTHEEGMDLVLDYLYDSLTVENLKHVSRVTIIHTSDFIIRNITRNVGQRGGMAYNFNCQFGNLIIPFAIIFESRNEE